MPTSGNNIQTNIVMIGASAFTFGDKMMVGMQILSHAIGKSSRNTK